MDVHEPECRPEETVRGFVWVNAWGGKGMSAYPREKPVRQRGQHRARLRQESAQLFEGQRGQ